MRTGPQGVSCGQNDASFREMLEQGSAFSRKIRTKAIARRGISTTSSDAHMRWRVSYRVSYVNPDSEPLELVFVVSNMLAARSQAYEISVRHRG